MFTYRTLSDLLAAEREVKRLNREANFRYATAPHSTKEQDDLFEECRRTARVCDAFDTAYGDLYDLGFRDDSAINEEAA